MSNTNDEVDIIQLCMTDESRGKTCKLCGAKGDIFQVYVNAHG
jgi:hypothetical protein